MRAAADAAAARGLSLEQVLLRDYAVPRQALLRALSGYYGCPSVEYDERLPIPGELLEGLEGGRLSQSRWFPVIREGDTVIIAASDPADAALAGEVRRYIGAGTYVYRVALEEDIRWFIQDFLHAKPGSLIGTERTGLAFWRTTMAQWRTRLACYRNDLAKGRTDLAVLRWGLGLIALASASMRTHASPVYLYGMLLLAGLALSVYGTAGYLGIRKARMRPPDPQTLVEVTAASMYFLEEYHCIEGTGIVTATKGTMLARLGDFLAGYCTILYPSPASKERTQFARERNVLAAQRTVAACYRTLYARARTGLAFLRTGVSFASLGLGFMAYFGFSFSAATLFDSLLVAAGMLLAADGVRWYMPARREQAEIPRCPVPVE
ncbi:MAG: type II secretion protein [Nitrospirales bacterium]|nr:type II secretion protein [Nitrospirales bacterium]